MSQRVLYGMDVSPPVRACLLTLKALNLPFEYKIVDLFAGEHHTPEFFKRNPQRTVPVLDDNGTWLWDSHAICAYLVSKYGKDDSLYPKDLAKRAVVDQRMYFDAGVLFKSMQNATRPLFRKQTTIISKEKVEIIHEGYVHMENFLAEQPYLAGENVTIADFCCVATMSSLNGLVTAKVEKFPKINAWLERLSQLPYYEEANGKGLKEYMGMLKPLITAVEA